MIPHKWVRGKDTVNKKGEPGHYLSCDGCKHNIWIPAEFNDFQEQLDITFYFERYMQCLPDHIRKMTFPYPPDDKYFKNRRMGLHGELSLNCAMAQACLLIEVMES
jgi:hypothetical protein